MSKKPNAKLVNVYEIMPQEFKPKTTNPQFHIHGIKVPFRMLIVGASGSGKTATLMNLINTMKDTFKKIVIITKDKSEPIYQWFESILKPPFLEIFEGIENIPLLDDFNVKDNTLCVFDDLMLEKNLSHVAQYFIRGRKKGISSVFLSQCFFIDNKDYRTIKLNCNYLLIKKLSGLRDITSIMKTYSLDISKSAFIEMYEDIVRQFNDFLLVDLDADAENRFRRNFEVISFSRQWA